MFMCEEKFPVNTYNKLQPCKYDMFKVTRKINDNVYMVTLLNFMNISNTFNVANIYEYHVNETLYQKENLGLSSSELGEIDV